MAASSSGGVIVRWGPRATRRTSSDRRSTAPAALGAPAAGGTTTRPRMLTGILAEVVIRASPATAASPQSSG